MATVQVRNLSDEAYEALRARARHAHQSLQEYLRSQLENLAAQPTVEEVLQRAAERPHGTTSFDDIVRAVRESRDSR